MRKLRLKSVNCLEGGKSTVWGRLILPAKKEIRLYNMEKNPEMKDSGERTWNMRKKDKMNIPITPAK